MAENEALETTETTVDQENSTPEIDYKAEYEKLLKENTKVKTALSKTNSEAADYKRKMRDLMSEDERSKAEAAEREAERKAYDEERDRKLAEYEKKDRIYSYSNKLRDSGFDGDVADAMAAALAEGDMDAVFARIKANNEAIKKSAVANAMANQSGMSVGKPSAPEITQSQFNAMTYLERLDLKTKDPALYESLVKGE